MSDRLFYLHLQMGVWGGEKGMGDTCQAGSWIYGLQEGQRGGGGRRGGPGSEL